MQIKGVRQKRNSRIKDFHNTLFFYFIFFSSGKYKNDDDDFSLLTTTYWKPTVRTLEQYLGGCSSIVRSVDFEKAFGCKINSIGAFDKAVFRALSNI